MVAIEAKGCWETPLASNIVPTFIFTNNEYQAPSPLTFSYTWE